LREFLARYPSSPLAIDVRERLDAIERADAGKREHMTRETAKGEASRVEQAEPERPAAEQTAPEKPEPTAAPGNVQTALLTPPAQPVPAAPSMPVLTRTALVQEIKKELKRVGCYGGRIDKSWPTAETTASAKKFAIYAKLAISGSDPTIELLDAVRRRSDRVCPLECTVRQVEKDGRCITKTCPSGSVLGRGGECEKQHERTTLLPHENSRSTGRETQKETPPQAPDKRMTCSDSFKICSQSVAGRGLVVSQTQCPAAYQKCLRTGVWQTHGHHGRGPFNRERR
jgi:hypothetical protein